VSALLVVCGCLVPVLNVAIDPYEVFRTEIVAPGSRINERVLKSSLILRAPRFDTVVFGSSMAGVMDPRWLGVDSAFNFSFFSANPADILKALQMLERADRLPHRIYIGLDPIMFMAPLTNVPQLQSPPELNRGPRWPFWRDYLFAASATSIVAKLREASGPLPRIEYDLKNGFYKMPLNEHLIEQSPVDFAAIHVEQASIPLGQDWWHAPAADDLRQLVHWLRGRPEMVATWYAQPLHPRLRAALGADAALYFHTIRDLIGPELVDFSLHPVGEDNSLWFDPRHFRPVAARFLAQRLQSVKQCTPPASAGA